MATYDLEEQEQLDEFKAWWKRWGTLVMLAAAVAVAAAGGWRWWQARGFNHAMEAASAYEKLAIAVDKEDDKTARDIGAALKQSYAETGFASRGALVLAKMDVITDKKDEAKKELEWVVAHTAESGLRDLARLRLAALLLDAKDYDGALKQLAEPHDAEFNARFDDLRGDVLATQGKLAEANKAYSAAYDALKEDSDFRHMVELKRDATR